jgi:hypothetical protein
VDPSKTLGQLTASEMQAFCDWTNQRQGGYGRTIQCDASGIPLETSQDQPTCVRELSQHASEPNCSATVAQWTMCFEWLLAHWCPPMLAMRPAECSVIQATCYASGGPPVDGGAD